MTHVFAKIKIKLVSYKCVSDPIEQIMSSSARHFRKIVILQACIHSQDSALACVFIGTITGHALADPTLLHNVPKPPPHRRIQGQISYNSA